MSTMATPTKCYSVSTVSQSWGPVRLPARELGRLKKGIMRVHIEQQDVAAGWETPGRDHGMTLDDPRDKLCNHPPASSLEWIAEIQRQFAHGRSATLEL